MRQVLIFLVLWALAPVAGCIAAVAWLLVLGALIGFGGFGPRVSDFLDIRNYAPFATAMFYSAPMAFYPAYTLCRLFVARGRRWVFAVFGFVASLFPAVLIALDDSGHLLSSISELDRFGPEVFELETLVSAASFAVGSTILTAAYLKLAVEGRRTEAMDARRQP
jgi:hypothetical protein